LDYNFGVNNTFYIHTTIVNGFDVNFEIVLDNIGGNNYNSYYFTIFLDTSGLYNPSSGHKYARSMRIRGINYPIYFTNGFLAANSRGITTNNYNTFTSGIPSINSIKIIKQTFEIIFASLDSSNFIPTILSTVNYYN
jgi:hypothetical protein